MANQPRRKPESGSRAPAAGLLRLARITTQCSKNLHRRFADQGRSLDLSDCEIVLLWTLSENAPAGLAQQKLPHELAVSPAQVSGLLERLRVRRLVDSRRAASDRRCQLWSLTDEGRRLLNEAVIELAPLAEAIESRIGQRNQRQIAAWLEAIACAPEFSVEIEQAVDSNASKSGRAA